MVRGRKPKPTAQKKLDGNPGKRPLNALEPTPAAGRPEPPAWLDAAARLEWERITKLLAAAGTLSLADAPALELYVQNYARWVEAQHKLQKFGIVLIKEGKYPVRSPYCIIADSAFRQMMAFLAEFGLTPSSRSRISLPADHQPKDALAAFVAKKKRA